MVSLTLSKGMSVLWILRSWSSLVMWWMSTHLGLMEVRMLCNDLFLKTSNYFGRHVLWHIQLLWKLHSSNCALVSYVPLLDFGKLPSVFLFMPWETASLLHRAKTVYRSVSHTTVTWEPGSLHCSSCYCALFCVCYVYDPESYTLFPW